MLGSVKSIGFALLLTVIFLEFSSYCVIQYKNKKSLSSAHVSFFRKDSPNGSIKPNKNFVLPMKENNSVRWKTNEFDVMVKTNGRGLREPFEVENADVDIAFFGDSFTLGHGVEWEDRYTTVFSKDKKFSNYKTVSFSYINGFQPEHYEYYLKANKDLKPIKVVVGLYLGNDLGSDLFETNYDAETNSLGLPLRRVLDDGGMANMPDIYMAPLDFLVERSFFAELAVRIIGNTPYRSRIFKKSNGQPNEPNSTSLDSGLDDLSKNRAILSLLRIKNVVVERGGTLSVLIIPQNFYFGSKNPHINSELRFKIDGLIRGGNLLTQVREVCKQVGLDCIDFPGLLDRQDYFDLDAHWNSSGHRKVGAALANYISLRPN